MPGGHRAADASPQDGRGGHAAALNALLDEWNDRRKGGPIEQAKIARYGTIDWPRHANGMRISWCRGSRKNKAARNFQMAGGVHFQMRPKNRARTKPFRQRIQRVTHVSGIKRNLCVRNGPVESGWGANGHTLRK